MIRLVRRTLVCVAVILLGGGAALPPPPVGAQAKTIVWNLPHVAAPTYYHTLNLRAFAEKVKEKSGGRLEIRVHPASSLYPGPELIPAVIEGRAEIAPVLSAYLTDVFLAMGVLELPFMTSSTEEHRKAAMALRPFYAEQLAKKGLILLTVHAWPSQQLYSIKKPVAKVDDWKGTKVRIYGAESAELAKTLGAAPVSVTFGELYTALQRGVIDAAITSATNAEPMKFFEVTRYMNYWYINGSSLEFLAVNKKVWDALPPDLRDAVTAGLKESRFEDKEWEDNKAWDERAKKRVQELGMTVVEVPKGEIEKARQISRASWDTWLNRTGADGKRALELALKALGR